jgi:hypothetical protein
MNSTLHHASAHQRRLDDLRAARRHALASVHPRDRRLAVYGSRILAAVTRRGEPLEPAADRW